MKRQLGITGCCLAALFAVFHGCDTGESGEPSGLCNPGGSIFCRCPGGAPGTKLCDPSGESFSECEPCEDRPSSGPGEYGGYYNEGGYGNEGGFTEGGGGHGATELLGACDADVECESGSCISSFCTKPCTMVSQCPYPESECVPFGDQTLCMPSCQTAGDCTMYTAPPSACGYAKAIDNWDVTVCANWGDDHELMPQFTDCLPFDHTACNLGYQQRELVCNEAGVCVKGCYVNADCPAAKTCSGQSGSFGQCQ